MQMITKVDSDYRVLQCCVLTSRSNCYIINSLIIYSVLGKQQQPFYGPCLGLPRWATTRRNIHSLTPNLINHPLSASFIYYDSVASSMFSLRGTWWKQM